jgi:hypothetical protein
VGDRLILLCEACFSIRELYNSPSPLAGLALALGETVV